MNTYLIKSKVDWIRKAQQDFFAEFGFDFTPFTRKIYFYFFVYNNKKYVYKEALNFVYTNADTWTTDVDPTTCHLQKDIAPPDVIKFLETYSGTLLPRLVINNSKFLVYDYFEGDPITHVTKDEFYKLKQHYNEMDLVPFYNSMAYNLVRTDDDIRLVDLKHFEHKDTKPFFIYLYNADANLNTLYVETNTNLDVISSHLNIDYPETNRIVIEY